MSNAHPESCRCALFARATEWAALAGARWLGRDDQDAAEEGWIRIPLHLTQGELGDLVGLARETVARTLTDLTLEGLIRRGGRRSVWVAEELLSNHR